MIYDCFSFFNELDLLEIRLNTLNDVVDKFVLVEAPWTHTGKAKPLYFKENRGRFSPFLDKIIHVILPPLCNLKGTEREQSWIRENNQRNAIKDGLKSATLKDILIISDLDEIPDPNVIREVSSTLQGVVNLNLRHYAYFLNNRNVVFPYWSGGPQMLTFETFINPKIYEGFVFNDCVLPCANKVPSATIIRFLSNKTQIPNAGWHFTSMGGITAIQNKLKSFAHTEFSTYADNPEALRKLIMRGKGLFDSADHFIAEPINENLPPYIANHVERFKDLLLPVDEKRWRNRNRLLSWYKFKKDLHDGFIAFLIKHIPKGLHPLCAKIRSKLN